MPVREGKSGANSILRKLPDRQGQNGTNTNALIICAFYSFPFGKDGASEAAVDSRLRGNDKERLNYDASLFKVFVLVVAAAGAAGARTARGTTATSTDLLCGPIFIGGLRIAGRENPLSPFFTTRAVSAFSGPAERTHQFEFIFAASANIFVYWHIHLSILSLRFFSHFSQTLFGKFLRYFNGRNFGVIS